MFFSVLIEVKEIVKTMKDQQEELIKIIDEQKEEFAHSMNQLRIQMTQNYRKQKKDLNIAKRQIIRRNEKSVASIIQYIKAGNVINIFFTLWEFYIPVSYFFKFNYMYVQPYYKIKYYNDFVL